MLINLNNRNYIYMSKHKRVYVRKLPISLCYITDCYKILNYKKIMNLIIIMTII